jgi:hypothetical protein
MLDKKSYLVLEAIVNASKDGESVVLEKEEILAAVDHMVNEEELGYCIEELTLNEMISLKYSDDSRGETSSYFADGGTDKKTPY